MIGKERKNWKRIKKEKQTAKHITLSTYPSRDILTLLLSFVARRNLIIKWKEDRNGKEKNFFFFFYPPFCMIFH